MLSDLFESALKEFFTKEAINIQNGVSERNLCCRLAMILEPRARAAGLTDYFADCEYNRNYGRVKTIIDGEHRVILVTCDILLHSRGILEKDNLIAIEMKKSGRNPQETRDDHNRLKALTQPQFPYEGNPDRHVFGYEVGYFLEIDSEGRAYHLDKFVGGSNVTGYDREF